MYSRRYEWRENAPEHAVCGYRVWLSSETTLNDDERRYTYSPKAEAVTVHHIPTYWPNRLGHLAQLSAGRRHATLIRQAAPSSRAKATIGKVHGAWRVAVACMLSCMRLEGAE